MDNKKTTIIIMSYDGSSSKTFNISTKLLGNSKNILIGFLSVCFLIFFGMSGLLIHYFSLRGHNNELTNSIVTLQKENEVIDSLKLKEKLQNIESNLNMIQSYITELGVSQNGFENNYNYSNHTSEPLIEKFEEQSELFLYTIKQTPLGLPYKGAVSSEYGYRKNPFGGYSGEFHPGIDFKGDTGDEVYATGSGIVERCDWYGGYGNAIVIRHENNISVIYGHLSKVNVIQGQQVKAGDLIGYIGSTGRSTGPHLHYEIRVSNEDINPKPFLLLFNNISK